MRSSKIDIAGIGNAMVDILIEADDGFLDSLGIPKGVMELVCEERAEAILAKAGATTAIPGGSVGNTIAGLGALQLGTASFGRVRDDSLGRLYIRETEASGTRFVGTPVAEASAGTSRSIIIVTPDGERSMSTYLGISSELGPEDVDETVAQNAGVLFLEGYLFDRPAGQDAFRKAAAACRAGGGRTGITLSDPRCVDRHRAQFQALLADDLDFAIGNIHEWEALYECPLEDALEAAARDCETVVCTRSGADVVLIQDGKRTEVPVRRVKPVDTTGAGDQFAAGFLYGYTTGRSMETAGSMGVLCAAEVITHLGARPRRSLLEDFHLAGLL